LKKEWASDLLSVSGRKEGGPWDTILHHRFRVN
jgi:hypothetical protein